MKFEIGNMIGSAPSVISPPAAMLAGLIARNRFN